MTLDFVTLGHYRKKDDWILFPQFVLTKSKDLMIRGKDFYAIWLEDRKTWSTDELDVVAAIDKDLEADAAIFMQTHEGRPKIQYMRNSDSGSIDAFHKYCQSQLRDNFRPLDEKLIFANDPYRKTDYATKRLPYALEPGDFSAYDELMSTLYDPEERHKLEWAIGAVVEGDSCDIQKFVVLYGSAGTGKSTVLNIIQKLFEGYYGVFDARALGSATNAFALEAFRSNPLVGIQHDGDLSRIEDNTKLNSLVSHERMSVNEKFKATYEAKFKTFLFMGTNKPVKITDSRSGLLRRLIDVSPSGRKLPLREYNALKKRIDFELGAIACHCREVYLSDPEYYDAYQPFAMMSITNDFYGFMQDLYFEHKDEGGVSLKSAWTEYKKFCEDTSVPYPMSQRSFREEIGTYFKDYYETYAASDNTKIRKYYKGFKLHMINRSQAVEEENAHREATKNDIVLPEWLSMTHKESLFDRECANCPAQYATPEGKPIKKWEEVTTVLKDLNTSAVHYVQVPLNHIVVDFDLKNEKGEKDATSNLLAAASFPATYAEYSKSGSGIHLHYLYSGDPTTLSRVYDDSIEVKVFTGNSSLRRCHTLSNGQKIATINSGLPLKGEKLMLGADFDGFKNEKAIRTMILRNLNKEYHAYTAPSVNYIHDILEKAYASGAPYDVSDLRPAVIQFAANSHNQSIKLLNLVKTFKWRSEDEYSQLDEEPEDRLIFFDCEVFPNLFLVNYKEAGEDKDVIRMINPSAEEVERLMKYPLVGFNNRKYDNHILWARTLGYNNEQLYRLSQTIITGKRNDGMFRDAYNISYTDVFDFSKKKQSLKKWEIELGISHQELGLPWDEPVPEEKWAEVAEYCDNDVIATEKVFNHLASDFTARKILADLAGMNVNTPTNTLTQRIIFGHNREPQSQFNYRDLSQPVRDLDHLPQRAAA